jgi:hypothetical protein
MPITAAMLTAHADNAAIFVLAARRRRRFLGSDVRAPDIFMESPNSTWLWTV